MQVQLFAIEQGQEIQLDTFEQEPIKFNISAENITDPTEVTSNFSRSFRLPATNTNGRFFKWWYLAGTIDFDITKRVEADIRINGITYKKGQLRLQKAYINGTSNNVELEVVFMGETKSFSTEVGDIKMNELNLIDTAHILDVQSVEDSWKDFGDSQLFLDGKIRYVLTDRGYDYNDNGSEQPVPGAAIASEVAVHTGACTDCSENHTNAFTKNSHPLHVTQFTPMIQVKYLIDKIFERTSYDYTADSLFNQSFFKFLYIDGISTGLPFTPNSNAQMLVRLENLQPVPQGLPLPFDIVETNNSGAYNTATFKYVAPVSGSYSFTTSVAGQAFNDGDPGQPPPEADLNIFKNSTVQQTQTQVGATANLNFVFNLSYTDTLNAGDEIFITMQFRNIDFEPFISDGSFACNNTPVQVSTRDLMKTDLNVIDFFKSILTKFRAVIVPTKDDPNIFRIQPWQEYIGSGQTFDWSNKIDLSKDMVLEPLFNDQKQIIEYKDQEGADVVNQYHKRTFGEIYGNRIFNSQNELLSDDKTIETEFAPTPVAKIDGAPDTTNFIIPLLYESTDEATDHGHTQKAPLEIKPRLLFWNGLRDTSNVDGSNQIIWYYSDGSTVFAEQLYPSVSYLSEIPATNNTLNLNWQKEFAYFALNGGPNGTAGESVFERYWQEYINNIYTKEARKLTANFILDSEDLRNLTLDDIIFVKDSYWRVQKLSDAPLGERSSVKVTLIKLLENVPPVGNTVVNKNSDEELLDKIADNINTEF